MKKTTVELPEALLRDVKRVALKEQTTVKALIERGLRLVVRERPAAFQMRRASFAGDGLAVGSSLRDWDAVRDEIYKERGA